MNAATHKEPTRASIYCAIIETRSKWLFALECGEFENAKKIQERLDELLEQLLVVTT